MKYNAGNYEMGANYRWVRLAYFQIHRSADSVKYHAPDIMCIQHITLH